MNPNHLVKATLFFLVIMVIPAATAFASPDPFPVPEVIKPNVAFWTKVYAQYTTSQGIIHDNRNLEMIYDIIDLVPYNQPGAARINRKRMKRANQKYERILWRLAKNPGTQNKECRKVAVLFPEPHTSAQFSKAARRVRCQIGQKDRFRAGLIRSGAYIDQIRSILVSNSVPEDLAYLPHVESSFNPKAYSKFGAAGIWQFTRSTGKRFMSVGYTLDERRDPILATHAAAELLKENYEKLGCWALAITAYNHGATGMQRAKSQHGDYSRIFQSYRSRTFKFASRNFYSEFIAARQVAANYQDYFGPLELNPPPVIQTVVLKGYAAFGDLSKHFNVSPDVLKELNPALRDPVFSGQKYVPRDYALRLPHQTLVDPSMLLAGIPDSIYRKTQKASRFYTVQRGDTAGKIARTHRVRLSDLILANNLDRRATIYPKQTLRIPTKDEKTKKQPKPPAVVPEPITVATAKPAVEAGPVDTARAEPRLSPEPAQEPAPLQEKAEPAPKRAPLMAKAEPALEAIEHQAGTKPEPVPETGIMASEVQADTAIETEPAEVTDDEEINFPQPVLASLIPLKQPERHVETVEKQDIADLLAHNEQIVAVDVEFLSTDTRNGRPVGMIQVEVEETLGHYAEWAQVRTQQIRNLNRLAFGEILNLHQKIKIPLHRTDADAFKQNRYEFHKRLQEDFFAVYRIGELKPYKVRRGDNFWTISRDKFEIPMWLLKHCNPESDLADLRMHQKIYIPTIEKRIDENSVPDSLGESDVEVEEQFQSQVKLETF